MVIGAKTPRAVVAAAGFDSAREPVNGGLRRSRPSHRSAGSTGAAVEAGGRDNGAPGLRPDYHAGYYAAFVIDPDGNNVEAVFHGDR